MEQISSLLAAAAVGGFAITAVAGKFMIPALHRLHFGQTIREEGPTWHSKKNGTPTMGGLCFILGILATLGIVWVMYSPKLPGGAWYAAAAGWYAGAVSRVRLGPHRLSG